MAYVYIDIDIDDVYTSMGSAEKELMSEWLQQEGYIAPKDSKDSDALILVDENALDAEWNGMITKLMESRYQLTPEQESLLFNLVNSL